MSTPSPVPDHPVRDLLARYSDAVRTADPAVFASCWADDAVWDLAGTQVTGAEAITAHFTTARGNVQACTQDVLAGRLAVAPGGDRASARWVVREDQVRATGPGLVVGVYTDEAVRTVDGWRFARRSFDLLWRGVDRTPAALGPDALVLSSGTLGSAPLVRKAMAAASAGFDGISVYVRELDTARAEGWSDDELRAFLGALGLSVAEVDGAFGWLGSPHDPARPVADLLLAGAALDARSATIHVPPGVPLRTDGDRAAAAAALADTAAAAAAHGLLLHLEPYPWSGLRDLGAALDLCRRAGTPGTGIMLDTWHLAVGPDKGRLPDDLPGDAVLGIQLGEAADPDPPDVAHAGMHERLLPGDGPAPIAAQVLAELRARGCTAPVGVEVFSDVLHAEKPRAAAEQAAAALHRVLPPPSPPVL
jgi:sugar phosphate isomerase/epimerase/ketosteroid isomerase-like protein